MLASILPGHHIGCTVQSQLSVSIGLTKMECPVLKGHPFIMRFNGESLLMVTFIELLPERPGEVYFTNTGCTE